MIEFEDLCQHRFEKIPGGWRVETCCRAIRTSGAHDEYFRWHFDQRPHETYRLIDAMKESVR